MPNYKQGVAVCRRVTTQRPCAGGIQLLRRETEVIQIATADAGTTYRHPHLTGVRVGPWDFSKFNPSVAGEECSTHIAYLCLTTSRG